MNLDNLGINTSMNINMTNDINFNIPITMDAIILIDNDNNYLCDSNIDI